MFPSVTYPAGKKRKRKATTLTQKKKNSLLRSTPIPSLPDDLLLSCFARVSGLYYPTLSLVSKSFRSLIASPELRNTRLSLGRKESCLYVCLRSDHNPNPNPCWFILCRKPDRTITNGSSGNVFVLTSFPNSVSANSRKEINIDGLSNGLEWYNFICVIENVSYIYHSGDLQWCDVTKIQGWKKLELKGLKGLPDIEGLDDYFQLVDYGGKLAVLWSELCCEKKIIRCAVIAIALEGHNIGEIHGEVEWCDEVLTVPKSFKSGYALTENV